MGQGWAGTVYWYGSEAGCVFGTNDCFKPVKGALEHWAEDEMVAGRMQE